MPSPMAPGLSCWPTGPVGPPRPGMCSPAGQEDPWPPCRSPPTSRRMRTRWHPPAPTAATCSSPELNQSNTATLTWSPAGFPADSVLVAIPLGGASPRLAILGSQVDTATDDTAGVPTCYVLVARAGGATLGSTNTLCGFPGVASLR